MRFANNMTLPCCWPVLQVPEDPVTTVVSVATVGGVVTATVGTLVGGTATGPASVVAGSTVCWPFFVSVSLAKNSPLKSLEIEFHLDCVTSNLF